MSLTSETKTHQEKSGGANKKVQTLNRKLVKWFFISANVATNSDSIIIIIIMIRPCLDLARRQVVVGIGRVDERS